MDNINEEPLTVFGLIYSLGVDKTMVYVISQTGTPLMPMNRHGKVRRLLNEGKAHVVRRTPFTIQLLYQSTEYTQPITLGVDAGSTRVGVSATTAEKVMLEMEVELRSDIVDLLSTRRQYRRSRRSRKTRYRPARFKNRKKNKTERVAGTFDPS